MINQRIAGLVCLLSLWGCSLSLDSDKPYSLFFSHSVATSELPELALSDLQTVSQYTRTCFLLTGGGEFYQSDIKTMNIQYDTGGQTEGIWLEFDLPRMAPGKKYSIELFGFQNLPTTVTQCPQAKDRASLKPYAQLGSLRFAAPKTDGRIQIEFDFKEFKRDDETLSW